MARFSFRLPDIGEGISEAEIVAWHVKLGDRVEEDQSVADMMTDKATVEMESPVSGTIIELAGEVGDQVPIGAALMVIETDAVEAVVSPATEEAVLEAENPGVEEAQTPSPPVREGRGEGTPQAESPVAAPHPAPLPQGEREIALLRRRGFRLPAPPLASRVKPLPPHRFRSPSAPIRSAPGRRPRPPVRRRCPTRGIPSRPWPCRSSCRRPTDPPRPGRRVARARRRSRPRKCLRRYRAGGR